MKDLLLKATTFEDFESAADIEVKNQMTEWFNREISKDIKDRIQAQDTEIHILAISELWCPDCVINDVALMHLHSLNSNIKIHVFTREIFNDEEMTSLLGGIEQRIPTFVILDSNYNKLGIFLEKPSKIVEISNSNDQVQKIIAMKAYRNGEYIENTLEDLLSIMEGK